MTYVELFIAPVPTSNRAVYEAMMVKMGALHREFGALEVVEAWGSHVPDGEITSFPLAVKLADDETVVAGWIRWPSKEVRDQAFDKMMSDPRMGEIMSAGFPFDGKRLVMGGFEEMMVLGGDHG
jgi:uncharacterized protein YbaA (DUF1428 family)